MSVTRRLPGPAVVTAIALLFTAHCRRGDAKPEAAPRANASVASAAEPAIVATLRSAEATRTTDAVPGAAQSDPDVIVRRAAARALARIADEAAGDRLERSLADEDAEVVAWAAHGLGATCTGREPAIVRALAARAASMMAAPRSRTSDARFALSPDEAVSDALARCGTNLAERTLTAWLAFPERSETAALALGRLAGKERKLDDATMIALLDAAARTPAVGGALYAFSRVAPVTGPVARRLLEVASAVIGRSGDAKLLAIRALGAAGPSAADTLAAVFVDEKARPDERSAAAATLGRLGAEALPVLARAVGQVVSASTPDEGWLRGHFALLTAALRVLPPKTGPDEPLIRLAELTYPAGAPPSLVRRVVELRCAAAAILANTASLSTRLVQCAPQGYERTGALSTVRVLDRGALVAGRFEAWKKLATSSDPAVRRAALALVPSHPEIVPIPSLLADALGASEPGVVAQAARILAADARRGTAQAPPDVPAGERGTPSEDVVDALGKALDAARPPDEIDTRAALAAAAGSLGALRLKPRVEKLCASDNVTLRRAAESALRQLGAGAVTCPQRSPPGKPKEVPARRTDMLVFVTDDGRLGITLDPTLSPLAVTRAVELAKSGFYDRMAIHRVVPGQVVQFGDKLGDGHGAAGLLPLPTESAPREFARYAVGMALAGRDTGSSQLFVTLAPEPSLFGDYPLLGWADSDWANVVEGDVIDHVLVKEQE